MTNDLISRQAAIKAIHEEFDECLVWDESGQQTADEVESILTSLPSAQPNLQQTCNKVATDLISRQAAIDALVEELAHRPDGYWDSGLKQYDVEVVLNQQPSIDAVEVVRCADCKYAKMGECEHKLGLIVANDENYCSYGVRKEQ